MTVQEMEALIAEAVRDADLRPEEIPCIDLYLDQITSLVAEKHKEGSARFEERTLTKTMINNYSKDGLLSPIKGKKYSREHILQMLLVYEMKNTLSIGEIKRILQNVYSLPGYSPALLESIYTRYLAVKDLERASSAELVGEFLRHHGLDAENEDDFLTLLMGLSAMSAYLKSIVRLLLEAHYPESDADAEKRDEKEAAKRRKNEQKAEKKAAKEKPKKEKPPVSADTTDEMRSESEEK